MNASGVMQTGWLYDGSKDVWYYLTNSGGMAIGWKKVEGKWYYFNPRSDGTMGKMFQGRWTLDGWFVKEDGEWDEQPKK